jgi:hypothetical protein
MSVNFHDFVRKLLGNKCSLCSSQIDLEIHHKDGNKQNSELENLQLLCKSCHTKTHIGRHYHVKKNDRERVTTLVSFESEVLRKSDEIVQKRMLVGIRTRSALISYALQRVFKDIPKNTY